MKTNSSRRQRVSLGVISINQLHETNPWVAMAWSVFLPGFGLMLASFEFSTYVETAVAALENIGIPRSHIFAAPLYRRDTHALQVDTRHRSDGKSLLDGVALLASLGTVLGTIYGFVLTWGPVIWGLIGFVIGALAGFVVKFAIAKRQSGKTPKTELVLIVDCESLYMEEVEKLLWDHKAFGISKINNGPPEVDVTTPR